MSVKVEAVWFDAAGEPCEPQDAVTGEITETEDGNVLRRTYVDHTTEGDRAVGEIFSVELEMPSQDGPKVTWDIRHLETQEPVDSLEGLRASLGVGLDDRQWRTKLCNMLQLPVWESAPARVKSEAYAWLVETRPER